MRIFLVLFAAAVGNAISNEDGEDFERPTRVRLSDVPYFRVINQNKDHRYKIINGREPKTISDEGEQIEDEVVHKKRSVVYSAISKFDEERICGYYKSKGYVPVFCNDDGEADRVGEEERTSEPYFSREGEPQHDAVDEQDTNCPHGYCCFRLNGQVFTTPCWSSSPVYAQYYRSDHDLSSFQQDLARDDDEDGDKKKKKKKKGPSKGTLIAGALLGAAAGHYATNHLLNRPPGSGFFGGSSYNQGYNNYGGYHQLQPQFGQQYYPPSPQISYPAQYPQYSTFQSSFPSYPQSHYYPHLAREQESRNPVFLISTEAGLNKPYGYSCQPFNTGSYSFISNYTP